MPNLLATEPSAYLKSAAHQPVHWHPWGEPAFARARAEDKPILLDIGAVWCHWCHVMDGESYDDPEVATRSEEHTSELQSLAYLVCRLLLEKKKKHENYHHRAQGGMLGLVR